MSDSRIRVRKLTTKDGETWTKVGDGQIFVSDIVVPRASGTGVIQSRQLFRRPPMPPRSATPSDRAE